MTSIIEHIKKYKIVYSVGIGIVILSSVVWWTEIRKDAYSIRINGTVVGEVKTKEEAEQALENAITNLEKTIKKDIIINNQITLEHVNGDSELVVQTEELQKIFETSINYQIEAVAIHVDGKTQAVVENEDTAYAVLAAIASGHLKENEELVFDNKEMVEELAKASEEAEGEEVAKASEEAEGEEVAKASEQGQVQQIGGEVLEELVAPSGIPTNIKKTEVHVGRTEAVQKAKLEAPSTNVKKTCTSFDFNKQVILERIYIDKDTMQTQEEAENILLSNTDEVVTYEMQPGDNIWDVAIKNETTMDRILEINPQIQDVTRMQIGEVIKIEAPDPVLAIATTEEAIFKEIIVADIEYIEDKTLFKGEEKVKQPGNDGVKEITVLVHRVNGKEVNREHLSEKILQEPNKKVIAYGTKEKPKGSAGPSVSASNSGMFMHPLNGAGRISSPYGSRWGTFHRGIDFAASKGTPIYAAASGTVIYSGYNNGGFGNLIMIDHGNGFQTYYAHNSKNHAKVGQKVIKGQNIASVGSTGNSTGNHVHFEIRKNGTPINPYSYLY